MYSHTTCIISSPCIFEVTTGSLASLYDKQIEDDSLQRFGEVIERLVSTWSTLEQVAFIKTGGSRRSVA